MKRFITILSIIIVLFSCNKETPINIPDPTDPSILGPKIKTVSVYNWNNILVESYTAEYTEEKPNKIYYNLSLDGIHNEWLLCNYSQPQKIVIKRKHLDGGSGTSFSPWYDCWVWYKDNLIDSTLYIAPAIGGGIWPNKMKYSRSNKMLINIYSNGIKFGESFTYDNNLLRRWEVLYDSNQDIYEEDYYTNNINPDSINTSLINNVLLNSYTGISEGTQSSIYPFYFFNREMSLAGSKVPHLIHTITASHSTGSTYRSEFLYTYDGKGRMSKIEEKFTNSTETFIRYTMNFEYFD